MYVEPPTQRLSKTEYDRPSTTITDTFQNDEAMLKKLEGYEEVDMLERVEYNTHVRYITLKEGVPRFCLGGLLKRVFEDYVVLSNGKLTWSVQRNFYNEQKQVIFNTKFYKYISKDRMNAMANVENTQEIQRFCERYKIPMYAIDDNEKCFKQYTPQNRNKNAPAMIYRVSNEHFYPCPNKKIQSIIQTTSIINNIDSVMMKNNFKVKDEEEEDKEYQNVNVEYVEDIMHKLVEVINNGGIPEKVNMLKKKLYGFKYGNNTYVSNENIDLIKK